MVEFYLASSALAKEQGEDRFDGRRTIDEAVKHDFDGVQLFLDPKYRDPLYRSEIFKRIDENPSLGIIIHLPNIVSQEDIEAAEDIAQKIPEARFLIHYKPTVEIPEINNVLAGWENSEIGKFGPDQVGHIDEVKKQAKKDNTFFVFDFGRMMYLEEGDIGKEEALRFIREEINALDPKKDIIHLADKTSWVLKFRDSMCALGDGICGDLLENILSYEGIVVFEHEDLQMAIDSLQVIEK